MEIRKAKLSDIDEMARLVTTYLGTCNISSGDKTVLELNKEEILQDIGGYYVCEEDGNILGLCGISEIRDINYFDHKLQFSKLQLHGREVLYLVVDENYRHQGIGTKLLRECSKMTDPVFYEAWGDGEKVNSYQVLKNCGFSMFIDLGDTYYKDHGYCPYCVNYDTGCCNSCKAEIWIKV